VNDKLSGYQCNFGILVIVNQGALTDETKIWYDALDRVDRDPIISRSVSALRI